MSTSKEKEIIRSSTWDLLRQKRRTATKNGQTYFYTNPSDAHPYQWFWDSCFIAIMLTHFGEEGIRWAKEEIRSLLAWQEDNGFIPHVIFWDSSKVTNRIWSWERIESTSILSTPRTTSMIQTPVLAQAIQYIWLADHDTKFLAEVVPKVARFYRYLEDFRDFDHDGLISIIAPMESGLDFSSAYDPALGLKSNRVRDLDFRFRGIEIFNKYILRYNLSLIARFGLFHVEDVLVNSVFAKNLEILSDLLREINDDQQAVWANIAAQNTHRALLEKCYDPERKIFWNLAGKNEKPCKVLTVISLMPLILRNLPTDVVEGLIGHLTNENEFWLPYPIPSVAASEPSFHPKSLVQKKSKAWRGSSWMSINWFLYHGLIEHGYNDLAQEISKRSTDLVLASGFREYYDPYTGEGLGATNFLWPGLVIDMF